MRSALTAALFAALASALPFLSGDAQAQATPTARSAFHPKGPVTIVVPYSAGGGTDAVGRLFARQLGELWGQTVVIDNRTGGNGSIGSSVVARAAPDGHTLLLAVSSLVINPHVMAKLPYDTRSAFTPITPLAYSVVVLVGSPRLEASDMKSFVALAKKDPGRYSFASSEPATRLTAERIFEAGGIKLTHIPYKGAAQWMTDVMSGTVDVGVASITSALPFMKDGRLKILGVAGDVRQDMLPHVATFKEQGIPGLESHGWYGLFATGGTPPAVVEAIHADVAKVLALPEVKAQLATYGALPGGQAPDAFAKRFQRELVEYGEMTRKLGMLAE